MEVTRSSARSLQEQTVACPKTQELTIKCQLLRVIFSSGIVTFTSIRNGKTSFEQKMSTNFQRFAKEKLSKYLRALLFWRAWLVRITDANLAGTLLQKTSHLFSHPTTQPNSFNNDGFNTTQAHLKTSSCCQCCCAKIKRNRKYAKSCIERLMTKSLTTAKPPNSNVI